MDIEEDNTSSELLNPFSEVNCNYSSRQRNSACFTINLKTVLLGTSEENVDSSAALLSSQEGPVDWQCTFDFEAKLDNTESVQKLHCHSSSREWQNSSCSSDESDSSDSDMDQKTEYIRRWISENHYYFNIWIEVVQLLFLDSTYRSCLFLFLTFCEYMPEHWKYTTLIFNKYFSDLSRLLQVWFRLNYPQRNKMTVQMQQKE